MKRRIAMISDHASPLAMLGGVDSGGQNVYVGELSRQLVTLGYQVDIYTRSDNANMPAVVEWLPDVRVIHVEAGPVEVIEKEKIFEFMPAFCSWMLEFIKRENLQYELIHAHFFMSGMVAMELKKTLGIPFIITFHALGAIRKIHQGSNDKFPVSRIDIEKQIVKEADHIVAECPQDKLDLLEHYDGEPEKITIIPCGFNPTEFYPMDKSLARMVLGIDSSECMLLQLGRIVPRKGIDNVIRALSRVKKLHPAVKLYVVGGESENDDDNNPEIQRLKKIAMEEGVSDAVIFAGRKNRDILKYYYAAADLFITTPWYEPFGITPLESMACGTPVIGADVGGIKFSVDDSRTGYLVPPKDPDALAIKIYEMLEDKELLKTMRLNAIRRVNSMFTWSKVADMVAALYERVLLLHPDSMDSNTLALNFIDSAFQHALTTINKTRDNLSVLIFRTASMLASSFRKGKKILVCGNGGSAAESHHFVAELVGRFGLPNRQALPAISLASDTATMTAWANDVGYDDVFARQVHAYGQKGDILFCLSTSGQSQNVIQAMKAAFEKDMYCIALTGKGGGEMAHYAHINMVVPSGNTQRVQEMHLHIIHTICSLIEARLFNGALKTPAVKQNGHKGNGVTNVGLQ